MDSKKNKLTAVILAGGKSSRMGQDKGILHIHGKPMVMHIIEAAREVSDNIIIVANNDNYNDFGYPVYRDHFPGCGPLGGIYTGLTRSATARNLFLSCDIPFVNGRLLKFLQNRSEYRQDALVPLHNDVKEPLCAIYHKRVLKTVLKQILKEDYKLQNLLEKLNVKYADPASVLLPETLFSNINTPEQLNHLRGIAI
jgi:molybdenum cofactor guanylyltransferase